ncbi:CAMK/CAMKL/AMPK protein kinase [Mycena maculata]|uniref:non-specific serine/threonine protein kinase n=1 Tax=Mycena maculata TaxID=230809 RepID=A0AAD7NIC7_9AGAR|nr:CAMK/CAMKL/AMPK protein kinase [Mycena maculata]
MNGSDAPLEQFETTQLGEYTVIDDIAEGTFGKVKMAIHTVTGHKVAMKFLSKAIIHRDRMKARVRREFEYMRLLRHPHIIKLYEVISTPTDIIFVLEYAEGELFNYIVNNGRLTEDVGRRFFQQIMAGIEYSHRLKIVHRDLKPENILLDEYQNVKIADFGLSNETVDGEFLATSCGSPNYAAPEVIKGLKYSGPEIDVWSSGIILYVLLCGKLPFEDEVIGSLFEKIQRRVSAIFHPRLSANFFADVRYDAPTHLSPHAQNLIKSMLVADPTKRITVPQIMQHPWVTVKLPRYLTPLPPLPGPVVGTLSSLVSAPIVPLDFEFVEGLGRIDDEVVDELVARLIGTDKEEIMHSLRRNDGIRGNQVKVAYMLLKDKKRVGKDLAVFAEQERDAELATMDPRNVLSPNALSPGGSDLDENPFETEFGEEDDAHEPDDGFDDVPEDDENASSNVAILNSSLRKPEATPTGPTGRANSRRPPKTARWHFGIRSRSSPMEVMLEIYKTLLSMGMEWKEKKNLGYLGRAATGRDDHHEDRSDESMRAAANIFCIETRARVQDIVVRLFLSQCGRRLLIRASLQVLMNINLYKVDELNYLVDFQHKKSYRASTAPDAKSRFERAPRESGAGEADSMTGSSGRSFFENGVPTDETVMSPFVFMDLATKLILELAGQ